MFIKSKLKDSAKIRLDKRDNFSSKGLILLTLSKYKSERKEASVSRRCRREV
jgi:hypothetical protein